MNLASVVIAAGMSAQGVNAQEPKRGELARPSEARESAKTPPPGRVEDEKALEALLDAFTKAFDAGDASAVAATYTETAVVVGEGGERTEGRDAIRDQYAGSFANDPGAKIAIEVEALKFLGPETALEEGRATITPSEGAPEITRFTAIYVKQGGQWRQAAVRDEPASDLVPHDRLKELEWLVGDWVNESLDAVVSTTCVWAAGGNFLDREFTMKVQGRPVLSGTQRIGWDPLRRQFKTWIFDSEGGHGEGHFTRDGDQWLVKVEGVNQDGQPVTATNIITRLGKDRMGWESTAKTLGGASVPGIDQFVVVRKPPEVGK